MLHPRLPNVATPPGGTTHAASTAASAVDRGLQGSPTLNNGGEAALADPSERLFPEVEQLAARKVLGGGYPTQLAEYGMSCGSAGTPARNSRAAARTAWFSSGCSSS